MESVPGFAISPCPLGNGDVASDAGLEGHGGAGAEGGVLQGVQEEGEGGVLHFHGVNRSFVHQVEVLEGAQEVLWGPRHTWKRLTPISIVSMGPSIQEDVLRGLL